MEEAKNLFGDAYGRSITKATRKPLEEILLCDLHELIRCSSSVSKAAHSLGVDGMILQVLLGKLPHISWAQSWVASMALNNIGKDGKLESIFNSLKKLTRMNAEVLFKENYDSPLPAIQLDINSISKKQIDFVRKNTPSITNAAGQLGVSRYALVKRLQETGKDALSSVQPHSFFQEEVPNRPMRSRTIDEVIEPGEEETPLKKQSGYEMP